jgi:hypothetical protein
LAVSEWLERLRSLVRTQDRAPDTAQSRRVEAALLDRSLFPSEAARLERVTAAIADEPVDARTLELLVAALKTPGFYAEVSDAEAAAHLAFWRRLVDRQPGNPIVAAHLADIEMALGDPAAAMARFVDVFDRKPDLFFEFGWDLEEDARALGGDVLFRWQLHLLRWFLQAAADHLESGDEAREIYGELLDEYREDADRLAALRPLGEEIHRLEVAGDLPRAMVVRRRRTT